MSVDVLRWEGLLEGEEVALPHNGGRAGGALLRRCPIELDPRVREAIGAPQLYAHQRAAWDAAERGENVMVATGTASGKTLAFNLPVLDALAPQGLHPLRLWE